MAGGLAVILVGAWLITQVTAGQALQRLNLIKDVVGS